MAKKDKEEEKKDVDQSPEEDFGLPDLEFDELEDIDEEEFDEADLENVEEEIAELIGETADDDELALDDIGVDDEEAESAITASIEEGESLSDIGESSESELGEVLEESTPIEDELQKETIDEELDEVEKFISEITADDVEEDSQSDSSGIGSEESESEELVTESSFDDDFTTTESTSKQSGGFSKSFIVYVVIGLVGAVTIAFALLTWGSEGEGDGEAAEAVSEQIEKPIEEKPVEEKPVETPTPVAEKPVETKPAPQQTVSTGTPGEITVINSSANRYYIVVASFIDVDMANDMGGELAAQGIGVKVIYPFNERKYYRVSVADYGTREEAVNATDSYKPQYGEDVWALKY